MMSETQDQLRLIGVMVQGYGIIPKLVMRDRELTAEAKAVYAYICSYSGAGNSAFPSMELMTHDLNMSEKRLRKHRNMLVEKGYLIVEQVRNGTKFTNNVYTLPTEVAEVPSGRFVPTQIASAQNVSAQIASTQNDWSNNNKLTNNNLINNNAKEEEEEALPLPSASLEELNNQQLEQQARKAFSCYEQNIGMLYPLVRDKIDMWLNEFDATEAGDIICFAIELTVERQKQWPYTNRILVDWSNRNVKKLSDARALQEEFVRKNGGKANGRTNRANGTTKGNTEQQQVSGDDGTRQRKSYTDKYLRKLQGEEAPTGDEE